jgi:hypothetical protein
VRNPKNFWSWGGRYVGYRLTDSLFSHAGRQLGYFAEGDEVYGCDGRYLGEVRAGDRLISNLSKKLWTRGAVVPSVQNSAPGCQDVSSKEMLVNFEEFLLS